MLKLIFIPYWILQLWWKQHCIFVLSLHLFRVIHIVPYYATLLLFESVCLYLLCNKRFEKYLWIRLAVYLWLFCYYLSFDRITIVILCQSFTVCLTCCLLHKLAKKLIVFSPKIFPFSSSLKRNIFVPFVFVNASFLFFGGLAFGSLHIPTSSLYNNF